MLIYKKNSVISKKSRISPLSRFTNSSIDDFSYISLFANVNNTKIGKYCSISINFKTGMGKHPTNFISTSPLFYSKKNAFKDFFAVNEGVFQEYSKIKIGNDVWIGADVIIMDGITIGDGVIIGAKAVVTKDIPNFAIVGGVPAKSIKYRFSEEIIEELERIQWWEWDREKIRKNKHLFSKKLNLKMLKTIVNE